MAHLTDEMLMAYVDGELNPAERAQVEHLLAADQVAQERLRIFAATREPLARLFDRPMQEPLPAALVDMIMGTAKPLGASASQGAVVQYISDWPARLRNLFASGPTWVSAAAWSVPVVIVVATGFWLVRETAGGEDFVELRSGQLFAGAPLKAALDSTPSGQAVRLGGNDSPANMEAVLTFRNRRLNFCRQYDVFTPSGDYAGIACRDRDGDWRLEIHIAVAPHAKSGNRITPAGKAGAAVEDAVSEIIEGDALGREDEQALIAKGWRP